MKIVDYVVPLLLLALLLYSLIKKTDIYSAFLKGGKKAINLVVSIFPCIVAIFLMLYKHFLMLSLRCATKKTCFVKRRA